MLLLVDWLPALGVAILSWLALWTWPRLRTWTMARKLPGPPALPFVGNALTFLRRPEKTFRMINELFVTHGPVVRVWLGTKLVVGLTGPADAQLVLTHPKVINRDPHFNAIINRVVDNGLLSALGVQHRRHRKLMAPAFHAKILATFVPTFGEKAEQLAGRLATLADGRVFDVKEQLSVCTLDAILETAIGVLDTNFGFARMVELKELFDGSLSLVYSRMATPWLLIDWLYPWTRDGRRATVLKQQSADFFKSLMAAKVDECAKNGGKTHAVITGGDRRVQSFLDMVFDASGTGASLFTHDQVREEVLTLAAAGMDTSANTMAYALILLAINPEYQQRALEEQRAVFQESLRVASLDDLPAMPFLELVIKETLRLFPPATVMPRQIPVDLEISNGFVLPAGCTAFIFNHSMHRDAANFVDPERFWPERWTPENSVGRHGYAYLPFSAGARNCIGQRYAALQMKATLSRVIRQFRFASAYTMQELNRIKINIANISAVGYNVQAFQRVW